MKIHEIIAKKLETETLEKISEVGAIGLNVDEEASDSIQERLDVLWYRFSPSSFEELQTLVFVLKQFGVHFQTQTDDQFLNKLEIIQTFINVHGFENIFAVTSKALQKLVNIYQFLEVSLATIVLEDLDKLQNFHLLVSAQSLDSLEEGKFSFIFKEFSIDSLSKWNANTVGSLNLIFNEFGIDLLKITQLDLKRKISNIKRLSVWSESFEIIQMRIDFIKSIKTDVTTLNQLEVSKLEKLVTALEPGVMKAEALEWFRTKFHFSLDNLFDSTLASVLEVKKKLTTLIGGDISYANIVLAEQLLAAFGEDDILVVKTDKVEKIAKAIPFQTIDSAPIFAQAFQENPQNVLEYISAFRLQVGPIDQKQCLMMDVHAKCYANFAEPIPGEMKDRITSAVESLERISACEEHSQCEAVVLGDLTKQICDHGHFDTI